MNIKTKNLLLFAIAALFLFASCEKDLYEEPIQQSHKKNQSKTLTGAEALRIAKKLNGVLKNNNSSLDVGSARILCPVGTIRFDEIREVIDTLGKVNYTFWVDHPESSDEKFFNLVLQEKNEESTVKLFEYTMTPEFAQQYKQTLSLVNYYGTVKQTTIESNRPCPENDFLVIVGPDPNSTSGGSSSNGSGGGPGGGNPNSGGAGGPIGGPGNTGGGTPWGNIILNVSIAAESPEEWIQVSQSPRYWRLAVQNNTGFGPEEPCSNELIIGVLNPVDKCSKEFLESKLSADQRLWLYLEHNSEFRNNIINFTASFTEVCDNQKMELGKELVREAMRGSKIDFENKIIVDPTFASNQKAFCVYNKLKNNNAFNKVLTPFNLQNPQAFIKLMTGVVADNERAHTAPPDSHNVIVITVNDDPLNTNGINHRPNVLLAQTIIHEILHAELFREIIEALGGSYSTNYDQVAYALEHSNYSDLVENFRLSQDWQHEFMAEYFRTTIAKVTQEYVTGIAVTGAPDALYMDLAWLGLNRPDVEAWTISLTQVERTAINQQIASYTTAHQNESCQ